MNGAGDLYSADQIVGKTLYGRTDIPLKREATDAAPVVFTVDKGKPVGVVYSWLNIKPGRKNIYWMFYDSSNKPFYAEHTEGRFSTSELAEQGAMTVKEQIEADKKAKESTKDFIERLFKYAIGITAVIGLVKILAPAKK